MNSFRAKLSMIFVRLYAMSLECSARDYFNITNLSRLVRIMEFRFFVYLGFFVFFECNSRYSAKEQNLLLLAWQNTSHFLFV